MLNQFRISDFGSRISSIHRAGYTLIELLITISITTIMITLGVSAYRRAADIQAIKADTEKILTTLASAQKASTSGETDCTTSSGPYLGERLTTTSGSNTITLVSTCQNGDGIPRTTELSRFIFESNNTLLFRPLNQGIDTGANPTQNIDYSYDDHRYRILVERSGTIKPVGEISP